MEELNMELMNVRKPRWGFSREGKKEGRAATPWRQKTRKDS